MILVRHLLARRLYPVLLLVAMQAPVVLGQSPAAFGQPSDGGSPSQKYAGMTITLGYRMSALQSA